MQTTSPTFAQSRGGRNKPTPTTHHPFASRDGAGTCRHEPWPWRGAARHHHRQYRPEQHRRLARGSVAELQWVVTAYTIAFAAFILTAGALGDRLGAKRIFMAGFAIFTLASLACALAPSAVFLIVARSVQGLAAAILVRTR